MFNPFTNDHQPYVPPNHSPAQNHRAEQPNAVKYGPWTLQPHPQPSHIPRATFRYAHHDTPTNTQSSLEQNYSNLFSGISEVFNTSTSKNTFSPASFTDIVCQKGREQRESIHTETPPPFQNHKQTIFKPSDFVTAELPSDRSTRQNTPEAIQKPENPPKNYIAGYTPSAQEVTTHQPVGKSSFDDDFFRRYTQPAENHVNTASRMALPFSLVGYPREFQGVQVRNTESFYTPNEIPPRSNNLKKTGTPIKLMNFMQTKEAPQQTTKYNPRSSEASDIQGQKLINFTKGRELESFFSHLEKAINFHHGIYINLIPEFKESLEQSSFPDYFKLFFNAIIDERMTVPSHEELNLFTTFNFEAITRVVQRSLEHHEFGNLIRIENNYGSCLQIEGHRVMLREEVTGRNLYPHPARTQVDDGWG
ncbi:hypothetical protein [uncultured Endozoicomonas sp.]|uniref:hypothetical protein n=1 Tax=uncultured Endozoicomonas sp. TaxID=432652 RepID=UPI0026065010|nr:hypothetical protein [uncultured Endozoicomonas sp.]